MRAASPVCGLLLGLALALVPALAAAGELSPELREAAARIWPEAPALSDRVVSYELAVSLDPEARALSGTERIRWRNPGSTPVAQLFFHLYLNAFESRATTFHREADGGFRRSFPSIGPDDWGYVDVPELRLADGPRLELRCEQPDATGQADADPEDCTVASVALPRPVEPGEVVELTLAFTARLPRVIARTGCSGEFCMVAQWFPKLAVYEPAGTRGAPADRWNVHQHHATTEFYADFGEYLVQLSTPESAVVGASGLLVEERHEGGRAIRTFVARDVHDFAFASSPLFELVEERFVDPAGKLPQVGLRLLVQPERRRLAGRYLAAVKAALAGFGRRLGPYPYAQLTIVDPPWNAPEAGGMEYPTLITVGATVSTTEDELPLEVLTVHETGHQWFHGMIASNEAEEAWLDEGLTTHVTGLVIDRDLGAQGRPVLRLGRLPLFTADIPYRYEDAIRAALGSPPLDPLLQDAWRYHSPVSYGLASYPRADLTLRTLEGLVGGEVWAKILATYAARWRFRHPGSADFLAVIEEVSGQELEPFFDAFVRGTETLDYAVESLTVEEERQVPGAHRQADGSRVVLDEEGIEAMAHVAKKASVLQPWRSAIVVRRTGAAGIPVELRVTFDDGSVREERWDGATAWKRFEYLGEAKVTRAQLDPERRLALDGDRSNDLRLAEPTHLVPVRWALFATGLLAQLLSLAGGLL